MLPIGSTNELAPSTQNKSLVPFFWGGGGGGEGGLRLSSPIKIVYSDCFTT